MDDQPTDGPWYGTDGMCDAEGIDGPNFPGNIDDLARPENAVEMINKIALSVRLVNYCL